MKFSASKSCGVRDPHLVKDEKLKKFWDDLADDWLASDDQKLPNMPSEKTSSQN